MKNMSLKILTLVLASCFLTCSNAYAISKLDFFTQVENFGKSVQKEQEKWENRYSNSLKHLHDKAIKAGGAEGGILFNILQKQMEGMVVDFSDNVKNQAVSGGKVDLGSSFSNATRNFANTQLAAAMAQSMLDDYKKALATERAAKEKNIDEELMILEARLKADKGDAKELEELAKRIAELKAEREDLKNQTALRDKKAEQLQKNATAAAKAVSDMEQTIAGKNTEKYLDKVTDSLFSGKKDEEDIEAQEEQQQLEDMYGADITEFFIGKYEYIGSKSIARVRTKRQQEYYKALQNLMRVLVVGAVKGEEFEKKSEAYLEQTTKVDGQLGGMAAKIGADVQNAKLAARYLELLLAEMRFTSMVEINSWNDKFKNTKQDVTKFNLDEYIYKKKSLRDTVNDKLQDSISGWQGF